MVDEARERLAGHDRVGVEDDHVAVVPSPAPEEVGDVAGLLVDRLPPLAVEDLPEAAHLLAELGPRDLLAHPLVGLVRIAQDEKIEIVGAVDLLHRLEDDPQPLEDAAHVLVEDRHHDGRRREPVRTARRGGRRDAAAVAPAVDHVESRKRRAEAHGDVREEGDEQDEEDDFQAGEAAPPVEVGDNPGRQARQDENRREEHEPPPVEAGRVHVFGGEDLHASG